MSYFNPRSPYGERLKFTVTVSTDHTFQSTLPLRGATFDYYATDPKAVISIHAPLTGSDQVEPLCSLRLDISIHAPLTGSDRALIGSPPPGYISIHAPLTGSDDKIGNIDKNKELFQSTLPLRGATGGQVISVGADIISIHAPLTGSD